LFMRSLDIIKKECDQFVFGALFGVSDQLTNDRLAGHALEGHLIVRLKARQREESATSPGRVALGSGPERCPGIASIAKLANPI
jgi:hypothetical protein